MIVAAVEWGGQDCYTHQTKYALMRAMAYLLASQACKSSRVRGLEYR